MVYQSLLAVLLTIGLSSVAQVAVAPDREKPLREIAAVALQLEREGNWRVAAEVRTRLYEEALKLFRDDAEVVDNIRDSLATALAVSGRYDEARVHLRRSIEICSKVRGEEGERRVADRWNRIGETFKAEGALTNALQCYERAEKAVPNGAAFKTLRATILLNQGIAFLLTDSWNAADESLNTALKLASEVSESPSLLTGMILTSLADLRRTEGKFAEAEREVKSALSITATSSNSLPRYEAEACYARVLLDLGKSREARRYSLSAASGVQRIKGWSDITVFSAKRTAALCMREERRFDIALSEVETLLNAVTNAPLGELSSILRLDRADLLNELGDFALARNAYLDLAAERTQAFGPDDRLALFAHERVVTTLLNAARPSDAHKEILKVVSARRKKANLMQGSFELGEALIDYAKVLRALGKLDEATRTLNEVFSIVKERFGSSKLAASLCVEYGRLYQAKEDGRTALSYYKQASEVLKVVSGGSGVPFARSELDIAELESRFGNLSDGLSRVIAAQAQIESATEADDPLRWTAGLTHGRILHRAGRLEEAKRQFDRVRADVHGRDTAVKGALYRNLVLLESDRGDKSAALAAGVSAFHEATNSWRNLLRFSSESDRLSWNDPEELFSVLGTLAPSDPAPLAESLLQLKGVVLDSLLLQKRILEASSTSEEKVRLVAAYDEFSSSTFYAETGNPGGTSKLRAARSRIERLERGISEKARLWTLENPNSLEHLRTKIPPDTALIDFVKYRALSNGRPTGMNLGAVVVTRNNHPRWIGFNNTSASNGAFNLCKTVSSMISKVLKNSTALTSLLAQAHKEIWKPVEEALPPEITKLIICPDGEIALISFATLFDGREFLGEKYQIRYVNSMRDILGWERPIPKVDSAIIVASPSFDANNRVKTTLEEGVLEYLGLRGGESSAVTSLPEYTVLPEFLKEAENLSGILREKGVGQVTLWKTDDASEEKIEGIKSPSILQIITHGSFISDHFLEQTSLLASRIKRELVPRHPFHRSWLALKGANETIRQWKNGEVPEPRDDGILTAAEVSHLSLGNTWLVCLSACETGLGVGMDGEGVFGLGRGFSLSGARNVLLTLWSVQDLHTRLFMEEFYGEALKSGDAASALSKTQKKLLSKWRTDPSLGEARAAQYAGPFVLFSR